MVKAGKLAGLGAALHCVLRVTSDSCVVPQRELCQSQRSVGLSTVGIPKSGPWSRFLCSNTS